jgi:hypothetical protein
VPYEAYRGGEVLRLGIHGPMVAGLVDVGVTEHVERIGEYSTHEFGVQPEAYEPQPEVEFT